jgi:hypothetical protein
MQDDNCLTLLENYNNDEAGEVVCERCNQYCPEIHPAPVRTMYPTGEQPQPLLCPICTDEWNDYWDEMWDEYYEGRI